MPHLCHSVPEGEENVDHYGKEQAQEIFHRVVLEFHVPGNGRFLTVFFPKEQIASRDYLVFIYAVGRRRRRR